MVRNSIGSNGYVADEIITSRSGVRVGNLFTGFIQMVYSWFFQVRVGNTDAEGRMAMVDCLCEAKEKAVTSLNPHLYTIATLTGHAIIAMGKGYSVSGLQMVVDRFDVDMVDCYGQWTSP